MSSCNGNCSTCGSNCSDRKAESQLAKLNEKASVKKVIAVVSGKGGVGKSTVTSSLAVAMAKKGYRVGILDADITGPSIPTAFGVNECSGATTDGLYPAITKNGIQVMSINLLLDNATDPVVWRGPVIAGAVKQFWTDVKQFWTDVIWEDVDYMFVDMPPGTGDVPACGWYRHRNQPSGLGVYDCYKGGQYGKYDAHSRPWLRGELQLLGMPRLQQEN